MSVVWEEIAELQNLGTATAQQVFSGSAASVNSAGLVEINYMIVKCR